MSLHRTHGSALNSRKVLSSRIGVLVEKVPLLVQKGASNGIGVGRVPLSVWKEVLALLHLCVAICLELLLLIQVSECEQILVVDSRIAVAHEAAGHLAIIVHAAHGKISRINGRHVASSRGKLAVLLVHIEAAICRGRVLVRVEGEVIVLLLDEGGRGARHHVWICSTMRCYADDCSRLRGSVLCLGLRQSKQQRLEGCGTQDSSGLRSDTNLGVLCVLRMTMPRQTWHVLAKSCERLTVCRAPARLRPGRGWSQRMSRLMNAFHLQS